MAFPQRISRFWKYVGSHADGMLVTSPENVRYLCGFNGSEGTLLMTRAQGFFLTDGRYTTQARREVSGFPVVTFKKKWEQIGRLATRLKIGRLGYEARHISVAMLQELEKHAGQRKLHPLAAELDSLRSCKDAGEIRLLKKAARIAADSLAQFCPWYGPACAKLSLPPSWTIACAATAAKAVHSRPSWHQVRAAPCPTPHRAIKKSRPGIF